MLHMHTLNSHKKTGLQQLKHISDQFSSFSNTFSIINTPKMFMQVILRVKEERRSGLFWISWRVCVWRLLIGWWFQLDGHKREFITHWFLPFLIDWNDKRVWIWALSYLVWRRQADVYCGVHRRVPVRRLQMCSIWLQLWLLSFRYRDHVHRRRFR